MPVGLGDWDKAGRGQFGEEDPCDSLGGGRGEGRPQQMVCRRVRDKIRRWIRSVVERLREGGDLLSLPVSLATVLCRFSVSLLELGLLPWVTTACLYHWESRIVVPSSTVG